MKIFMDLGLSALFSHYMHAIYIQMSQSWLLSQLRYVKFENRDMSKFSQLLRPTLELFYTIMPILELQQFHMYSDSDYSTMCTPI